ncbi:hypothetical protein TELCIR_08352 [Teladorsagia circumcincta]|uniref:Unspecific monooxygenase n=1 Tax=Teladorsagia circumcincta TaxID=45464 RepID=A0A2G9UI07_TELCI|nr:hypothetical protein TELCIR_08352 [Teladorsagia circumcincta]
MEKDRREGRHPSQSYKEDELLYDVLDLWIAGQETTAITVLWGLMHLIKNPSVIEKIRAELHLITNGNRSVSLSDKDHTPYLNWTVLFDPGRYEEGGKELEQRIIPFGIGKRSCIGETLAKAEIYLILANMISRYNIREDPEVPIDLKTTTPIGMMHRPRNFNIILELLKY